MQKDTAKLKSWKLALGIVVPVLILIVAIVMVSVSFAWYTNATETVISSIDLSVEELVTIEFGGDDTSAERNINYKGQTAIKPSGTNGENSMLICDKNGRMNGMSGSALDQYAMDTPYFFITTISLDTKNYDVVMDLILATAKISILNVDNEEVSLKEYGEGHLPVSDIPYLFTWYFREVPQNAANPRKNFSGAIDGEEDGRVMDYLSAAPTNGETWYTPYGALTFDNSGYVKSINGTTINNQRTFNPFAESKQSTKLNTGAGAKQYDFYIVFAPEKLFWSQYFLYFYDGSKTRATMQDLYGTGDDLVSAYKIIDDNPSGTGSKQMYYSNMAYFGSKFTFTALIDVLSMTSTEG